jgi:hypothetical protein
MSYPQNAHGYELKALRPGDKPYKRSDARGLYVLVNTDGARWWRFRYRVSGREKLISLGTYPDTSLRLAREKRDEARRRLAAGIDPSAERQAAKLAAAATPSRPSAASGSRFRSRSSQRRRSPRLSGC